MVVCLLMVDGSEAAMHRGGTFSDGWLKSMAILL